MSNLILEHTPNGIVLLNDKGCILEANAAAKALFLDMADELKGAHIESLLNEVPYKQVQQKRPPVVGTNHRDGRPKAYRRAERSAVAKWRLLAAVKGYYRRRTKRTGEKNVWTR